MRSPCPANPITRPAYQGSNPISDIWAVHALRIVAKYLKRYVTQRGRKQNRKTTFHLHVKCGSPDPEMSWASLLTKKISHCTYRSTRDQQPLEGAPWGQMKTGSFDLKRQRSWGDNIGAPNLWRMQVEGLFIKASKPNLGEGRCPLRSGYQGQKWEPRDRCWPCPIRPCPDAHGVDPWANAHELNLRNKCVEMSVLGDMKAFLKRFLKGLERFMHEIAIIDSWERAKIYLEMKTDPWDIKTCAKSNCPLYLYTTEGKNRAG